MVAAPALVLNMTVEPFDQPVERVIVFRLVSALFARVFDHAFDKDNLVVLKILIYITGNHK